MLACIFRAAENLLFSVTLQLQLYGRFLTPSGHDGAVLHCVWRLWWEENPPFSTPVWRGWVWGKSAGVKFLSRHPPNDGDVCRGSLNCNPIYFYTEPTVQSYLSPLLGNTCIIEGHFYEVRALLGKGTFVPRPKGKHPLPKRQTSASDFTAEVQVDLEKQIQLDTSVFSQELMVVCFCMLILNCLLHDCQHTHFFILHSFCSHISVHMLLLVLHNGNTSTCCEWLSLRWEPIS